MADLDPTLNPNDPGITVTLGGLQGSDRAPIASGESMGPRATVDRLEVEAEVTVAPLGQGADDPSGVVQLLKADSPQKYIIAGEIDRGGMGTILRAVDRDLRREVAMKVLNGPEDPRARRRFVEEAQVAGQLEHPNIVPVHDLEIDADGRLFFTMKLVRGRSLGALLEELRTVPAAAVEWPLGRLTRVFLSVCHAIAFAHDRGVVHRDLKPANIMLGDFGEVLVMDWGLARVRRTGPSDSVVAEPDPASDRLASLVESIHTGRVEGTPAYMPPEQARGDLTAIDERSDVYALGAILYEILTLQPPVVGKTLRETLDAVIAGMIPVPESRNPERDVPSELSAITRKALARLPEDRYQKVTELRRDVELWLEDRAVSAKEDSTIETLVKLFRRNQEVVWVALVCILIVVAVTVTSVIAIVRERHRYRQQAEQAELNLVRFQDEQRQRVDDQRRTAPALVAKARRSLDRREFNEALEDSRLALQFDPQLADARLLAAQLAIQFRSWDEAQRHLDAYRSLRADDLDAGNLLEQVAAERGAERSGDTARMTRIADLLVRQGCFTVAESLYTSARQLVPVYKARLERAWRGCTERSFAVDAEGRLTIGGLYKRSDVTDLSPLEGMPIATLSLVNTRVIDLTPLAKMPLTHLDLTGTAVRDLTPLMGLPLVSLRLGGTRVDDLRPLAGMRLESLDLSGTQITDLAPLAGAPLKELLLSGTAVGDLAVLRGMSLNRLDLRSTRVRDLAPLAGQQLTEFDAGQTGIVDPTPLAGMPLTRLRLDGTRVADLSVLAGMPLIELELAGAPVSDLRPLSGLPLTRLDLTSTAVAGLEPLQGMKIASLLLADTRVGELRPLSGMPLTLLDLARTPVADLRPLRGAPLTVLVLDGTRVASLEPLRMAPLKDLRLGGTAVSDLTPLLDERGPGRTLRRVILPPGQPEGLSALTELPSLEQLGQVWEGSWSRVPPVDR